MGKAKVNKIWTKAEKASARMHLSLSYRTGKLKVNTETVAIRLNKLNDKEFNLLTDLIIKHGY